MPFEANEADPPEAPRDGAPWPFEADGVGWDGVEGVGWGVGGGRGQLLAEVAIKTRVEEQALAGQVLAIFCAALWFLHF